MIMGTHDLWFNLMIDPRTLDQELVQSRYDTELFDLIVYLIYNGIAVNNSVNALHASTNPDDVQKRNIGARKLYTIKFLLFKLLAHLKWDLAKVLANLPTVHQEFVFIEFKKFCDQENLDCWRLFADLLYHRWVMYFEQKSTYPGKNNFKIYNNSVNQAMLDPYFVSPDVQENLIKKVQSAGFYSVNEIEKYVKQLETGGIGPIRMPTFDSFQIAVNGGDALPDKFRFVSERDVDLTKDESFLENLYYELAIWHYIHEDYAKANHYFTKIKSDIAKQDLDDYIKITDRLVSKNFKMYTDRDEHGEPFEKELAKFLRSIIKQNENIYEFDLEKDKKEKEKKMLQVLKRFSANECQTEGQLFLFKRLAKYLIFKFNGLYDRLDPSVRSLIFAADGEQQKNSHDQQHGRSPRTDMAMMNQYEVIEEGEIDDEEIVFEEEEECDPESKLLRATEPEVILGLIPSIKRPAHLIKQKWLIPSYDPVLQAVSTASGGKIDLQKIQLILAKANELRSAKLFKESRILYLSLLEDIQASNPMLAEMIRYEMLQTDLERFLWQQKSDSSHDHDLKMRSIKFLRDINKSGYPYFKELIELVCLYFLDHSHSSLQEFGNHKVEVVRFSVCLSQVAFYPNQRDNKEFWDYCIGSLIVANSKYVNNFPRVQFSVSFADFISRFRLNLTVANVICAALMKLYGIVTEKIFHIPAEFDYFPSSMSSNIINSVDVRLTAVTIDHTLRAYRQVFPCELNLLRYYAEYSLHENLYRQAMKHFVQLTLHHTDYFTRFEYLEKNDAVLQQMIECCTKMGHHVLAGILYQFYANPDYGHAFKELSQCNYIDSVDDLYQYIWDVTLLEFLINFHARRGEDERKQRAHQLISQLDINSNNGPVVLREASNLRKTNLFRMLAKQYLS